jgi:heat shock protein HtpX
MNRVELEGVVAHELSHVKNRDTLVMAIVATLVGIVVLLVDYMFRAAMWGGLRSRRSEGGAPVAAIAAVVSLIGMILLPIFARLMQAAVSRRREFFADMQGVQLTRYPPGLIGALEKLKADTTVVRTAVRATGHLWIESPLDTGKDNWNLRLNRLFSTHPPLEERIARLRKMRM